MKSEGHRREGDRGQPRPRPALKKRACPTPKLSARLTVEQQTAVAEHALSHTLGETVAWLADQDIQANARAVSEFLSQYQLTRQLEQNAATVETLLETLAAHDQTITPERLQVIGQLFFAQLALEKRDPRIWHQVQQIELRKQRLELERQKHREKSENRNGPTSASKGGLSAETLERIEREIKLM